MDKTGLGDRMKGYERVARTSLVRRMPVILRVDGRTFHTFTKAAGFERPFCGLMSICMGDVARNLIKEIQGAKVAYVQSDEVSVLITDYDTLTTDAWFANSTQKMASVAASIATVSFISGLMSCFNTEQLLIKHKIKWPQFDARVFNLPREEVVNYFVWRQQDATRNSIQMLGRTYFSHGDLKMVSCNEIQNMLVTEKGINWNDTPTRYKRGFCVSRAGADYEIPIFTQDREYLEKFIHPDLTQAESVL